MENIYVGRDGSQSDAEDVENIAEENWSFMLEKKQIHFGYEYIFQDFQKTNLFCREILYFCKCYIN